MWIDTTMKVAEASATTACVRNPAGPPAVDVALVSDDAAKRSADDDAKHELEIAWPSP
jgi:hypothetical protein